MSSKARVSMYRGPSRTRGGAYVGTTLKQHSFNVSRLLRKREICLLEWRLFWALGFNGLRRDLSFAGGRGCHSRVSVLERQRWGHSRLIRGSCVAHSRLMRGSFAAHAWLIRGSFAAHAWLIRGSFAAFSDVFRTGDSLWAPDQSSHAPAILQTATNSRTTSHPPSWSMITSNAIH